MSAAYPITKYFPIKGESGYAGIYIIPFVEAAEASTFSDDRFSLDKAAAGAVREANRILQEACTRMRYLEELEWKAFFANPHVQAELERLAEEAEREFAAGETEEGGFALE